MTVIVTDPDFNFSELDWKLYRYKWYSEQYLLGSWLMSQAGRSSCQLLEKVRCYPKDPSLSKILRR